MMAAFRYWLTIFFCKELRNKSAKSSQQSGVHVKSSPWMTSRKTKPIENLSIICLSQSLNLNHPHFFGFIIDQWFFDIFSQGPENHMQSM